MRAGSGKRCAIAIAATIAALAGCTPDPVPPLPPLPAPEAVFVDWTAKVGAPDLGVTCLALRDFDGDGRTDLLTELPRMNPPVIRLLRNPGKTPFTKRDQPATGLDGILGCSAVDFDGDGDSDLLLTGFVRNGPPKLVLWRNDGTAFAELLSLTLDDWQGTRLDVRNTAWGDFDGDGWQDLVVTTFTQSGFQVTECAAEPERFSCGMPATVHTASPRFFRNVQGHALEPMPLPAPGPALTNGLGVVDWNADGKLDLFLSNDFGENDFLLRTGDRFTEQLGPWGERYRNHGMGVAFADFDHDGRWDLYNANAGPGQLLMQRAGGKIEDLTDASLLAKAEEFSSSWSPLAGDFNNDGETDLYLTNAFVGSSRQQLDLIFRGATPPNLPPQEDWLLLKGGTVAFLRMGVPQRKDDNLPAPGSALSAMADLDGDGRLDVVSSYGREENELRVLHNEAAQTNRHWLEIDLRGEAPNVLAEGAVVVLQYADGTEDRRQVANDGVGTSDRILHFGLGQHKLDNIAVRWADGSSSDFDPPDAVDQRIRLDP